MKVNVAMAAPSVVMAAILGAVPMQALAAPAAEADQAAVASADNGGIPDVIVTANKREQKLQDTPTSIGVITSDDLVKRQITDIEQVTRNIAGLNVINAGPGQNTLMIRGLVGAGESTVGLYYDNMPTAGTGDSAASSGGRQTDFLMYDVQRVEVLRGPQSTLYGSSALAGVVRVLSNPAKLNVTEGRIDLDGSLVNHGQAGYAVKGMINVPLGDSVAFRIVGYGIHTPGFIDNTSYHKDNFNSADTWGFRWNGTYQLGPNTTATTQLYVQDLKSNGQGYVWSRPSVIGGVALPGAGDLQSRTQSREPYHDRSILAGLTLEHQFDNMTLTFTQSYQRRRNESFTDQQGLPLFFGFLQSIGAFPPITLPKAITFRSAQELTMWNSELRLATNFDGPLNFIVGGIYQNRTTKINNSFVDVDLTTGNPIFANPVWYERAGDFKLTQWAGFGEATLKLSDKFSILGGVRVFQNKRHDIATSIVPFLRLGTAGAPDDVRSTESKAIYKFEADYKPTRDIMLYASASQGYRAGGTIVRVIPELPPSYGPDYTWNFEAGAKTDWFNRALQFNIALYRVNWYNTQISGDFFNGTFSGILNCSGLCARSQGVEFDLTARPVRGLELTASGTVFKAKWLKDQPAISGSPVAGTQFANTPTFTLNGSAAYTVNLSGDNSVELRVDAQHRGKYAYMDYRPQFNLMAPQAFTLVNAAITLAHQDKWNAGVYVRNLLDKRANINSIADTVTPYQTLVAQPRTVGVQLGYKF
ncbi:TonB-dependent receptor [Sphingomonas lycopersici]|uniref:TonB-dependent receptor n=2 Tax=Sphingomonas TaxID=13687 RepID=A0AA42CQI0_9SPHN|nr:TonB-dependent receptor [Sphingomonas lycopersici]MCW6535339.1 TonB-dependent receptor [Sphingomonas lycopersici]